MTTTESTSQGNITQETGGGSVDGKAPSPAALRERLCYPRVDGTLFDEAVVCFEHGAYRAALVMTWLMVAEGIRHRFRVAAERDAELTDLLNEIKGREDKREAIDSFLLDKARRHGMISVHEKQELAHIRDQRNQYAHPSGKSPTPMQVLAALDAAVRIVLSRPALHRKEWAAALVKKAATERTFFPRYPDGLRAYAREIDPLLTEEARQHLLHTAFGLLDGLARDPSRSDLAENVTILAAAILSAHPELVTTLDCARRMESRQLGAALVCLQPRVFDRLDSPLRSATLASLLDPPVGAAPEWQPDVQILIAVQKLHDARPLAKVWADELRKRIFALPLNELAELGVPPAAHAERLLEELRSRNWPRQNAACKALHNLGPAWCASLPEQVQEQLGRNVLQSAQGDAMDADWLLGQIGKEANRWPRRFVYGIAAECIVNDHGHLRLKVTKITRVEAILDERHDQREIIGSVAEAAAASPHATSQKSFLRALRTFAKERRRPSPLYDAVLMRFGSFGAIKDGRPGTPRSD